MSTPVDDWHGDVPSDREVPKADDQSLECVQFLQDFVVLAALHQRDVNETLDLVEAAVGDGGDESRLICQDYVLATQASVVQEPHQTHEVHWRCTAVAEVQIGSDFLLCGHPGLPDSCFSDSMSVFRYK